MARCEPHDPPARFPPADPDAAHDSPPRWRKVLYAQQPYEDTHTGETFLEELVVNATIPQRDYATVVWSTLVVDQQLSTVAAVGSASFHVYKGTITARQLLLVDVLLMLLGSLLYLAARAWAGETTAGDAAAEAAGSGSRTSSASSPTKPGWSQQHSPGSSMQGSPWHSPYASPSKQPPLSVATSVQGGASTWPAGWTATLDGAGSLASLVVATALLSPLLGTLTETVSSDSIIACACLLQLAHLFLHDYHFSAALTSHLSGSLALGAAVCGSVLIASRLGSPAAVYAQLLLSLELYILGPYCRRQVAAASPAAHLVVTVAMAAGVAALLARQSVLLTSTFLCALTFVTFICPMWLVRIHKFKAAINGPWDEAVPRLSRAVTQQLSRC
ncbi:Phosphatidylinositol N-acetylglucosaminyltransferase GPI2 subunit [Chlorella vulgaris]